MKKTSKNSQNFLLGLIILLLISTTVQATALVYISTNMGSVNSQAVSVTALPDMAGGC